MKLNTPEFVEIALDMDTGGDLGGQGSDVGSIEDVAVDDGALDSSTPTDEPYFSYDYGEEGSGAFKDRDELASAWRENYLRRSDYTKKTQALADERKQYEADLKKFQGDQETFKLLSQKYDQWQELLDKIPEEKFMEFLNGVPSMVETPEMRKLREENESLKSQQDKDREAQEKAAAQEQARLENVKADEALAKRLKGYDAAKVQERIDKMLSEPPALQQEMLKELIWNAIAAELTAAPSTPPKTPYQGSSQSGSTPKGGVDFSQDWDELGEQAAAAFGK